MSFFPWCINGWCCIQQPSNEPNRDKITISFIVDRVCPYSPLLPYVYVVLRLFYSILRLFYEVFRLLYIITMLFLSFVMDKKAP